MIIIKKTSFFINLYYYPNNFNITLLIIKATPLLLIASLYKQIPSAIPTIKHKITIKQIPKIDILSSIIASFSKTSSFYSKSLKDEY